MNIFSDMARGASAFRADFAGSDRSAISDYWYRPMGWGTSTGGVLISPETAKSIATVYACVSVIARMVAMLPCKIYKDNGPEGKELASQLPEYNILYSQPNDRQTAFEFRMMMQAHQELRGNAYAEKVYDGRGRLTALLPMHPDRVTPEVLTSGRMRYKYADPLTNQTRILVQEEVFHLRMWSEDGYVGQSTISASPMVFGVALAEQDYTSRFFQNDARTGQYLSGGNFKTDLDKEKFREKWQQAQTGKNRHKTPILPAGMEIKELGVKPSDAQLLDARKFSRIELCSLFGVPPHLIGETEKTATYASVEQFNLMFSVQCLLPRFVMWEQAIQRDLLMNTDYFAKFSMAALLRGDNATRTAAEATAIQWGWMCQDDVRMLEDMNPLPNGLGKTYWRPLNMAPLGQLTNGNSAGGPDTSDAPELGTDSDGGADGNLAYNIRLLGAMSGKTPAETTEILKRMAA